MKQVWFDCKANPPKNGQFVRTKIDVPIWGDREIPLQWDSGAWFFIDGTVCHNYQPTHWREWLLPPSSHRKSGDSIVGTACYESESDGLQLSDEIIKICVDFEGGEPVELDGVTFTMAVDHCEFLPENTELIVMYREARQVFLDAEETRERLFLLAQLGDTPEAELQKFFQGAQK